MVTKHVKRRTLKRGGNNKLYTTYLQKIENYVNFTKQHENINENKNKINFSEEMLKTIENVDREIKFVETNMNNEMAKFAEKLSKLNADKDFFTNNIDIFDSLVQLIRNYDKLSKFQQNILHKLFVQKNIVSNNKAHSILWYEILIYYKNHTDVLKNPNTDFRNNVIVPFIFNSGKPRDGTLYIIALLAFNMNFEINHVEKNYKTMGYDQNSFVEKLFSYPYPFSTYEPQFIYESQYRALFLYYSYYFKDVNSTQFLEKQGFRIYTDKILKNNDETHQVIKNINEKFDYYNMPEYKLTYEQFEDFVTNKSKFIEIMTDRMPNNTQQLTNLLYVMNNANNQTLDPDTVQLLSEYTTTNPIKKSNQKKSKKSNI